MAWFRCFISGESFPGQLVGEAGPASSEPRVLDVPPDSPPVQGWLF